MIKFSQHIVLPVVLGIVAGASGTQLAVAQAVAAAPVQELAEVVVSARKREESLLVVPVAISTLSKEEMNEAAIDELGKVLTATVGMEYSERDGDRASAQPGVRGMKSIETGIAQRVSTFIDGMPMVGPQATINFVDVQGVEIYRGPQSAVFGRSVFAGALNYNTRSPSLDHAEGGVNGQFGQDKTLAGSGWVSVPLVRDKLAFSASVAGDSYGGPGEVKSTDGYDMGTRDTKYYSAALLFKPVDALSMKLRYTKTKINDGPSTDYNLNPALDPNIKRSPRAGNFAPLYYGALNFVDDPVLRRNFCYHPGLADQNCILDPGWHLDRNRLAFDTSYEFANGHNLSFRAMKSDDTVFGIDDQDNTDLAIDAMSIVNMGADTSIDEHYYEVVWTSPDAQRLRYTLGASSYTYFNLNVAYFIYPTSALNGVGSAPSTGTQDVKNRGVFGGLFFDVTPALTASLEARQQRDEITANDPNPSDDKIPQAITNSFLPRVALNYKYSDSISFYAQYAKGVQPATVNSDAVAPQQRATAAALQGLVVNGVTYTSAVPFLDGVINVDGEVLHNYEIGMKGRFLNGRLDFNASLFLMKTKGYAEATNLFYFPAGSNSAAVQAAVSAANPGNPLLQNLSDTSFRVRGSVNVADLRSRGIELESTYLLNDNWELGGQMTYMDTIFDKGCIPIGADFGLDNALINLPGGATLKCTTVDGNAFPQIPKFQAALSATYKKQLSNRLDWFARVDMRYADKQYMDWFSAGWIPSYSRWNLRAGIHSGALRAEAYLENVLDDRTPPGAQYEPDRKEVGAALGLQGPTATTGLNVAMPRPREAGVRLSYQF